MATTDDVDDASGLVECPLDLAAVRGLLQVRPEARVDDVRATESTLAARLTSMWVAGEPVVYIGLAGTSLVYRIRQYYTTALGARAPHAGGWPVKMLESSRLWVHYAPCPDPTSTERELVSAFAAGLPSAVRAALIDVDAVVPFANLMVPGGRRKRHGLSGVKEARDAATPALADEPKTPAVLLAPARPELRLHPSGPALRTQNITPADVSGGRIRVPSATKRVFPRERSTIDVDLFGELVAGCRWDPGYGSDRERSGNISIPKGMLQRLVRPGAPLTVTRIDGGVRLS
ncbi:MAG: hypothetical protein ABIW84_02130 [Ilumatobacteraceae bacterium]